MSNNVRLLESEDVISGGLTPDVNDVGGKAASLFRLVAAGIPVPPFCAVPAALFRRQLAVPQVAAAFGSILVSLGEAGVPGDGTATLIDDEAARLRETIVSAGPPQGMRDAVAASQLRFGGRPCAVRSSMVGEDSASHSFAGQLDTFLYRTGTDDICDAILRCWASAFGDRVLVYGKGSGLSLDELRVGVVVQAMVDADSAGVMFTADPVTQDRDITVITAAWGQGEGVVSGLCDTDEYRVSHKTRHPEMTIAHKAVQVVRSTEPGHDPVPAPVPEDLVDAACLDAQQVAALAEMGETIAEAMGTPQDIEWAIASGDLYILQARPITTMRASVPTAGPKRTWDNSNIAESYPGVVSPLTYSFAQRAYATVFLRAAESIGLSTKILRPYEPAAQDLIGLLDGHVYYNLDAWMKLLELLPHFGRSKADLEEMMGVAVPLTYVPEEPTSLERLSRLATLARVATKLGPKLARVDSDIVRFEGHFSRVVDRINRRNLANATLSELAEKMVILETELLAKWTPEIVNDVRVMFSTGRLRRFLEREGACQDRNALRTQMADLLGGIEGIASLEPTRHLVDLAFRARSIPAAEAVLTGKDFPAEAAVRLATLRDVAPEIAHGVDEYIERYGDRCVNELKLETIPLSEDPTFVLSVIEAYMAQPDLTPESLKSGERDRYEAARDQVEANLSLSRRHSLARILTAARHAVAARERIRMLRTSAFGMARDIYRAMGHRLVEAGIFDDPSDIFYLTVDEISAFEAGRAVTTDLGGLVALRRAEFARHATARLADRIETVGTVALCDLAPASTQPTAGDVLKGQGVCAGVVEAPVRVVRTPGSDLRLEGHILVAERTDPGWAPLFPAASGLLVEHGSPLSHSAVLARELGLPAVVGIPGILCALQDEDVIRMDGTAGTVERIGSGVSNGDLAGNCEVTTAVKKGSL